MRREVLCKTVGGVPCDVLEIGENFAPDGTQKPLAVATARVHPGESNSSWMMQGLLQFLCSPCEAARLLRDVCMWLVVPMLNPDGVIQGNYRCGLAGADLNREFLEPHRRLHPTVWHLRERMKGRRVDVYLDFHGHSKREGIFFYGGKYAGTGTDDRNAHVQLLPRLCSLASSDFKFSHSVFAVQEAKLTTARLAAFQHLGILHSYTVEASFSDAGPADDTSGALAVGAQRHGNSMPMMKTASRHSIACRHVLPRPQLAPQSSPVQSPTSRRTSAASITSMSSVMLGGAGSSSEAMFPGAENRSGEARGDPTADAEARTFTPIRLGLAGPTIGRALAAMWITTKNRKMPRTTGHHHRNSIASSLYDDVEAAKWPHLRLELLTGVHARMVLAQLLAQLGCSAGRSMMKEEVPMASSPDSDDAGSDSEPSGDEKPPEELTQIHRKILATLGKGGDELSLEAANVGSGKLQLRIVRLPTAVVLPGRQHSGCSPASAAQQQQHLPRQQQHQQQQQRRQYRRPEWVSWSDWCRRSSSGRSSCSSSTTGTSRVKGGGRRRSFCQLRPRPQCEAALCNSGWHSQRLVCRAAAALPEPLVRELRRRGRREQREIL
eukprot:NODE_213_length_3388_cov_7.278136.p1 GENE.NODE_213_length_3388_cov_7.278136~~NODE_213_length_3388_cov_7.278136.p1  ORF type:complete len:607 (-),score=142.37 NODE_213_length_3388_cov_7.278136:1202-3022(-)